MEHKFTTENFETEVLGAELPVLVDFYADWCGPCKMMAPIVERIAQEYDGKLKVGKCNVDECMIIAQKYRIASIPTFMIFDKGEVVDTFIGGMSYDDLCDKIDEKI